MPLEEGEELSAERAERARKDALIHPAGVGHFLSADAKTTMIAVRLKGDNLEVPQLAPVVEKVRQTASAILSPAGLRLRTAGHPSIRIDLLATLRSEVLKFALLSAAVSSVIALLIFRTPLAVLIAVAGPSMGVVWTLGLMGWLDIKIDVLSVVLPTLLFVVGFTDSVHLISELQVSLDHGHTGVAAAKEAVGHVGPACLLTAITTMAGFGSLAVARLDCIQHFGLTCALGTAVMFLAVQLVVPAMGASRLGAGLKSRLRTDGSRIFAQFLERSYGLMLLYPRPVAVASVLFTMVCFGTSLRLRSDQRWTESLPETSESTQVTADSDRLFGGSMFAFVAVEWPEGMDLGSREVLQVLQEVHAASEGLEILRGPLSALTLLESTRRPNDQLSDQVRHLRRAPPALLSRFVRFDLRKAAVSLHAPDVGAARLAPDFARLDQRLSQVKVQHPDFDLRLTGTVVVAARNVNQMIRDLAWSLTFASTLIFVIITALFRSLSFGLLSIVPNILPQAITASLLVVLGQPLTMTAVLSFSLCLGLSVDDTVHFLMRFGTEKQRQGTLRAAVMRTFQAVGGVMISTSLVLIGGFLAMLASQMPSVRMFAVLCCTTLVAAILGDLVMLPSLILVAFGGRARPALRASNTVAHETKTEEARR
jgi:predicted RND superfamily exporter protein